MIKRILLSLTPFVLVACATAPRARVAEYHEAVTAVPSATVPGSCHAPNAATSDYRELVPLANACVKARSFDVVEAYGQALATRAPQVPWGLYYLALAADARGDHARARWMIDRAIARAPDQALFQFELARIAWAAGGDDALVHAAMARAAALDPKLVDAHLFLGRMALSRADYAEAKRELSLVLAADADQPSALLSLAEVELKANDFAAAEAILTRAVRANPRVLNARLELARVQESHLKKFEEALRTLTEVRALGAERKLDQTAPADLYQRIQSLEKTVTQARRDQESSRMPSAERK